MPKIKTVTHDFPLRAFSTKMLSRGDFCYISYEKEGDTVHKYDGGEVHGISLNDVVEIDLRYGIPKNHEVQLGGMINILSSGIVILQVKGENLPHLTNVYLTKKGNVSSKKKKGRPLVGRTVSSQDEDGFVQVSIQF